MKTLHSEIGKGRQGNKYTEYLKTAGKENLRVVIYADSYDFQSCAKVELHAKGEWSELADIHYSQMAVNYRASNSTEKKAWYQADRDNLVELAEKILGTN